MNEVLFHIHQIGVTPWKLIGYLGVLLFTSRWFVQMYATRKLRRVHMPRAFWWLSIAGSLMLVSYFTFGKNDSVRRREAGAPTGWMFWASWPLGPCTSS